MIQETGIGRQAWLLGLDFYGYSRRLATTEQRLMRLIRMEYTPSMIRSVKLSLKFATGEKRRQVVSVLERYRSSVNGYIRYIWKNGGSLNKATADAVPLGHLSFRQRAHALQHAIGIVSSSRASAKATGKKASCPKFAGGMKLSKQLATQGPAESKEFDLWIKLSTLQSGKRIWLPLKKTKVLNKWLAIPGSRLREGCEIIKRRGGLFVILWVEIPDSSPRQIGGELGVDVGINKLIATSSCQKIGSNFKQVSETVRRRKRGSKGMRRARITRDQYINWCVNQLPWESLRLIAVENLKNLKKGKKANRNKSFRKSVAPWRYASVLGRIELKAQENCVLRVEVSPSYTSQTCPECKHRAVSNRANESFHCVSCGFTGDADFVGAKNILARALGEPMVPQTATSF